VSSVPPYDRAYYDRAPEEPFDEPEYFEGVLWRRTFAYGFDVVVIAFIAVVVWVVFAILTLISFGLLAPILWPIFAVIPVIYSTLLIGGPHSATYGMRLFDLEVRAWNGEKPGYLQAAVKTILFYVTAGITFFLMLLVALFNRRRRTVHDFLAGTVVIRRNPAPFPFRN
jgi:uncharacterized RDD family membrane protein YckC